MAFEKFKKALKEFIWADKLRDTSTVHQYVRLDEDGGLHVDPQIMNTIGMRRQLEGAAMLAQLQREQRKSQSQSSEKKLKR